MSKRPAIGFRDLTLGYDRHPAVHHVTGEVGRGEMLALVGPNGAGKSTLLKGIMGELAPLGGGIDLHGLTRRDIAYLPQQIDIDRSFPISVLDCVSHRAVAGDRHLAWARCAAEDVASAHALATVGLLDFAQRPIGALSGGQFQRALFARLMLQDASLILLDEPFRAIDAHDGRRSHGADRTLARRGPHGHRRAARSRAGARAFPETLLLAREVVAWGETRKVLSATNLAKARHAVRRLRTSTRPSAHATRRAGAGARMIVALIEPFIEFAFMRRALVGCLALSLGAPPIGVFLVLRRMSLMGDAMSHAILPGAAIGFLVAGLSLSGHEPRRLRRRPRGGAAAGLVARATALREDASLAAFYLVSLALGVLIVSVKGSNVDLLHVLFGTVLALDDAALILVGGDRDGHPRRRSRSSTGRWCSNASIRNSCAR